MGESVILLGVLWLAARLYHHPPPQRIALLVGVKVSGHNSWFQFDDDDKIWTYKFNQSVRIWDPYLRHVEISIGAVRREHLTAILKFRVNCLLTKITSLW